jgi:chitodextrinase
VTDQPEQNARIVTLSDGRKVTIEAPPGFAGVAETKVNVKIELRDEDGNVVETREANTVTTSGKNGIADQILAAPTLGKPTHMAIGTGSPAANALGTELDRNALTSKTRSGAVVTMVGDWAAGDGTGAITEAGIFDASSTGNMWTSVSFSVVNKSATMALSITWTLTIS